MFVTTDGKEGGELPGHPDKLIRNEPVMSPDGKRIAFTVNEDPPTDADGNLRRHVFVCDADGKGGQFKTPVNAASALTAAGWRVVRVTERHLTIGRRQLAADLAALTQPGGRSPSK